MLWSVNMFFKWIRYDTNSTLMSVVQPDFCLGWGTIPSLSPFLPPFLFSLLCIPPHYPSHSLRPYHLDAARGIGELYALTADLGLTVSGAFWGRVAPLLTIALIWAIDICVWCCVRLWVKHKFFCVISEGSGPPGPPVGCTTDLSCAWKLRKLPV